jgi:hypothetical protein
MIAQIYRKSFKELHSIIALPIKSHIVEIPKGMLAVLDFCWKGFFIMPIINLFVSQHCVHLFK